MKKTINIKLIFSMLVLVIFYVISLNQVNADSNLSKNYNNKKIIVKFKNNSDFSKSKKSIESVLGTKISKVNTIRSGSKNVYVIKTKSSITNIDDKITKLKMNSKIETAQPSYYYKKMILSKSDSYNKIQKRSSNLFSNWHYDYVAGDKVLKNDKEITIGIVDTGIDANHPKLAGLVDEGLSKNFIDSKEKSWQDKDGHGTHVSGLASSVAIDGLGKVGLSNNTKLVALRVLSEKISFEDSETDVLVEAINYAQEKNIDVLNMSLGGGGYDEILYSAIASYDGIIVVAAGNMRDTEASYPAAYTKYLDNVISVGSIEKGGFKSSFSNYSDASVDVFAPGGGITSTCSVNLNDCTYLGANQYDAEKGVSYLSGTSMSAPVVTGLVANLLAMDNDFENAEIKKILINESNKTDILEQYSKSKGYVTQANFDDAESNIIKESDVVVSDDVKQLTSINGETITKKYITQKNVFLYTGSSLYFSVNQSLKDLPRESQTYSEAGLSFVKFKPYKNTETISYVDTQYNIEKDSYDKIRVVTKLGNATINYYFNNAKVDLDNDYGKANLYLFERAVFKNGLHAEVLGFSDVNYKIRGSLKNTITFVKGEEIDLGDGWTLITEDNYLITKSVFNQKNVKSNVKKTTYYSEYDGDVEKIEIRDANNLLTKKITNYIVYYDFDMDLLDGNLIKQFEEVIVTNYQKGKISNKKHYYYNDDCELKKGATYKKINYKNSKISSVHTGDYSSSGKLVNILIKNKYVYHKSYIDSYKYYYKSNSYKYTIHRKSNNNKMISYTLNEYKNNYKNKVIKKKTNIKYHSDKKSLKNEYYYNAKGKLQSTSKHGKAYKYTTKYKNGKAYESKKYMYDSRGKMQSGTKVKTRK